MGRSGGNLRPKLCRSSSTRLFERVTNRLLGLRAISTVLSLIQFEAKQWCGPCRPRLCRLFGGCMSQAQSENITSGRIENYGSRCPWPTCWWRRLNRPQRFIGLTRTVPSDASAMPFRTRHPPKEETVMKWELHYVSYCWGVLNHEKV